MSPLRACFCTDIGSGVPSVEKIGPQLPKRAGRRGGGQKKLSKSVTAKDTDRTFNTHTHTHTHTHTQIQIQSPLLFCRSRTEPKRTDPGIN